MTSEEAARYAGLSQSQLTWLCRQGHIECRKFGRAWMVSRASVRAYMQRWYPDWKAPE